MGSREGFKEYAQKLRDLAGRVQPPLNDREMVDMFMGTLTGPFFNLLIGSSSSGFKDGSDWRKDQKWYQEWEDPDGCIF